MESKNAPSIQISELPNSPFLLFQIMDWRNSRITCGVMGSCGLRRSVQSVAIGVVLLESYSVLRELETLGKSTSVCTFSRIYNFWDSNSDTGSASVALGRVPPFNGLTFFGKAWGRYTDGCLIIDFFETLQAWCVGILDTQYWSNWMFALLYFGHTAEPNGTNSNGCIKSYIEVAQEFNKQLKDKMINLRSQLQDAMLIYVDIYSVKCSWISDGKNNGFPDPVGYCCRRFGVVECREKAMFDGT